MAHPKKTRFLFILASATLALAGCSDSTGGSGTPGTGVTSPETAPGEPSPGEPSPTDPAGTASPTSPSTAAPRDLLALGETAVRQTDDGGPLFRITIEEATLMDECAILDGGTATPENGTFVAIHVEAELDAAYAEEPDAGDDPFISLMPESFYLVDESGSPLRSHSGSASSCLVTEELDLFLEPGASAQGWVMLDGPTEATAVDYDPDGAGGWSWELP